MLLGLPWRLWDALCTCCARAAPQKPVSRANSRDRPHLDRGCAHGVDLGVFGELVAVVVVDLRVPDACGRCGDGPR